jgi:lipoprotein NlpI
MGKMYPSLQVALTDRAVVESHLDRPHDAIADLTNDLQMGGTNQVLAEIYVARAQEYENLGQWSDVLSDTDRAVALNDKDANLFATLGRANFMMQDWPGAVRAFKRSLEINPRNLYTMLWLALARGHLGDPVPQELRRISAGVDLSGWPGPIIRALLGDVPMESIRLPSSPQEGGWSEQDQILGEKCELAFYWGEYLLLRGEMGRAGEQLSAATKTGIIEYLEYRAARHELARLAQYRQ